MASARSAPLSLLGASLLLVFLVAAAPAALAGEAAQPQRAACDGTQDLASCVAEGGSSRTPLPGLQAETLLVQTKGLTQRASATSVVSASAAAAGAQAAASHVRGFWSDAVSVGKAIKAGFVAVTEALPLFSEGKVMDGLTALANGLLGAVTLVLPGNLTESSAFAQFQDKWANVWEALPGLVATVSVGVEAFKEEGDVLALVRAVVVVVQEVAPSALQYLPAEVGVEVAKYLGAVEDALQGFEQGMEVYGTGNATDAVWEVYLGLRTAIGELLSEDLKNDENFAVAVDLLDDTIANLGSLILKVKQQLLSSNACWKVYSSRERARPDVCPDGHWFDGLHWCFVEGSNQPMQIQSRDGLCASGTRSMGTGPVWVGGRVNMAACDRSTSDQQWFFDSATGHIRNLRGQCLDAMGEGSKVRMRACKTSYANQEWELVESDGSIRTKDGGLCLDALQHTEEGTHAQSSPCDADAEGQRWLVSAGSAALLDLSVARKKETGAQTVAATCDTRTPFSEQVGTWCYEACPAGTEASGGRCRTKCGGAFPAASPLMCARSFRALALTVQEMASGAITMAINGKSTFFSTGLAGGLPNTAEALWEMGLGFTHPNCP